MNERNRTSALRAVALEAHGMCSPQPTEWSLESKEAFVRDEAHVHMCTNTNTGAPGNDTWLIY